MFTVKFSLIFFPCWHAPPWRDSADLFFLSIWVVHKVLLRLSFFKNHMFKFFSPLNVLQLTTINYHDWTSEDYCPSLSESQMEDASGPSRTQKVYPKHLLIRLLFPSYSSISDTRQQFPWCSIFHNTFVVEQAIS